MWLKANNIYYKHIEICHNNLAALPEDGDITPLLHSMDILDKQSDDTIESSDENSDQNELWESNVPKINNLNQENYINDQLVLDYPEQSSTPIDEFKTEGMHYNSSNMYIVFR